MEIKEIKKELEKLAKEAKGASVVIEDEAFADIISPGFYNAEAMINIIASGLK